MSCVLAYSPKLKEKKNVQEAQAQKKQITNANVIYWHYACLKLLRTIYVFLIKWSAKQMWIKAIALICVTLLVIEVNEHYTMRQIILAF